MDANLNDTSDISTTDDGNDIIIIDRNMELWLITLINIMSLSCSLFHLYHLLSKRTLRGALSNHPISALICIIFVIQWIDIPIYINYLRLGYVWPQTSLFCIIWWNTDVITFTMVLVVVTEASVAKYILIFHEKLLSTRKKRLLFHYIPLVITIMYTLLFYLSVEFFPTVLEPHPISYTKPWCDYDPGYVYNPFLGAWDIFFNQMGPTIVSFISDIVLILRVIWHKRIRLHQPIVWKKHRKMTIQLLSISIFCSSFDIPYMTYNILLYFNVLPSIDSYLMLNVWFASLFSMLFLPCVMLFSLPKEYWWGKWWTRFFRRRQRQRQIAPLAIPIRKQQ